ncbi:hypothetical protein PP352_21475 [Mycobacteroides abscessus]|nr:hypothetical protein [Mycobacteroides abscessus]
MTHHEAAVPSPVGYGIASFAWLLPIRRDGASLFSAAIILDYYSSGAQTEHIQSMLYSQGWQPAVTLNGPFAQVATCALTLGAGRRAALDLGEQGMPVAGLSNLDPVWIAIAHMSGRVDVLAGALRLSGETETERGALVTLAARHGGVLAASVPVDNKSR